MPPTPSSSPGLRLQGPNMLDLPDPSSCSDTAPLPNSEHTMLLEENLAVYCQPFGAAMNEADNSPGDSDSIFMPNNSYMAAMYPSLRCSTPQTSSHCLSNVSENCLDPYTV